MENDFVNNFSAFYLDNIKLKLYQQTHLIVMKKLVCKSNLPVVSRIYKVNHKKFYNTIVNLRFYKPIFQ